MRLLLVLLIFNSFALFAQKEECDCYKYFNGTFYSLSDPESKDTVLVIREDEYQFEYVYNEKANKLRLWVIWTDECTYILRDPNENNSRSTKVMNGDVVNKIIATGDNYYTVKAWYKGGKKVEITLYVYEGKV